MTLSIQVVDRLFSRMAATYGAAWDRSLGQAPINDVKSAWAYELGNFAGRLEAVAWALENLPERCPNVIEFRNLCRSAPAPEGPRLPEPKADPARLRAELAKLGNYRAYQAPQGRDWARWIVARAEGGERVAPCTLLFAKQALGRADASRANGAAHGA